MRRFSSPVLFALMFFALSASASSLGCKSKNADEKKVGVDSNLDPGYGRDVDRFCFTEERADVLHIETTTRGLLAAEWLGKNLETDKAREFLVSLTRVSSAEKAKRLRHEGARAGLSGCPTADAWDRQAELDAQK